jgi:signal transduction histidine kinase
MVTRAALGRAVLISRSAVTLTAAGTGLRLVGDPYPLLAVLAIVVLTTVGGLLVVSRSPRVVRHPLPIIAIDTLIVVVVLWLSRGGVGYFCVATGACALGGVLLGMRSLLLCVPHAALGYVVAAHLLNMTNPAPEVAVFVLVFPMAGVLAGVGTAVAASALSRYFTLSVEVVASAQRSAAASERARLARELHDSVAKTLHGVSFAALALPASLRRHPALAERLASVVSQGATAAAREARELLTGLRLDNPDRDFTATVREICEHWSAATAMPVRLSAAPVEPPVAVRYELCRILYEALRNITQHARASHAEVDLRHQPHRVALRIIDDGQGFGVPDDLLQLHADNHYGITGMSERALSVGGTLRVLSSPGHGTTIEVSVPLPRATSSVPRPRDAATDRAQRSEPRPRGRRP